MCGESWLAIKDSLTHRPSSQGWASSVRFYAVLLCACPCLLLCKIVCPWDTSGVFLSFSVTLLGWCAIHNNFMLLLLYNLVQVSVCFNQTILLLLSDQLSLVSLFNLSFQLGYDRDISYSGFSRVSETDTEDAEQLCGCSLVPDGCGNGGAPL